MRLPTRRLSLQLTPLLDLLLIVIFAQYMEVAGREDSVKQQAVEARSIADTTSAELDRLQSENADLQARLQDQQKLTQAIGEERSVVEAREREALQALRQTLINEQILGALMTDLFHIPAETINEVVDPKRQPPISDSPQDLKRLREQFQQMAQQSPWQAVKHLLAFEEVKKRCDFWFIHLPEESNVLLVNAGNDQHRFIPRKGDNSLVDAADAEERLYLLFRSLPQPKGLVIVLYSHHRRAILSAADPLGAAIQRAIQRLRVDDNGRTRYEFSSLGITDE
ncbi:MAG: hypothetical protein R3C01_04175 [Planctomycetaceae bacterium]